MIAVSPPLRGALIAVEPSLATLLFCVGLAGAALRWRFRRRPIERRRLRRFEAAVGRLLDRWGWVGAVLAMLVPLLASWALQPPAGTTAYAALLGHVPWSDGRGHFEGGVRLLSDGAFGFFSERRPLNAAWLAVQLVVGGGRLGFALVTQAVLAGLAAFWMARVVGRRFGLWCAIATFGLVQGLARDAIPAVLTETLGVTLACAALALLLSRRATTQLGVMALGLFALAVALDARPGPQLLLPALLLWGADFFRRRWRTAVAVLAGAILLSALSTKTLNLLYGAHEGSSSAYLAYTFYGLTRNSNCDQADFDYREVLKTLPTEEERGRFLYKQAFAALRREPLLFVQGLVGNELKFVRKTPANLVRILTLRAFFAPAVERARPSVGERRLDMLFGLPLLVAAGIAALVWLRHARRADRLFWLAVAAGILMSVPLVYGDSGFRCLAVSYPFFALFLALGFSSRRRWLPGTTQYGAERVATASAAALVIGIVALSIVAPGPLRRLWPRPDPRELVGLVPGRTLLVSVERAPAVLVSRAPRAGLSRVPWIREHEFHALLDLAEFADADLQGLRLPFSLISVYDFVTRHQYLLVGPVDLLRQPGFVKVDVEVIGGDGAGDGTVVRATRFVASGGPSDGAAASAPAQ